MYFKIILLFNEVSILNITKEIIDLSSKFYKIIKPKTERKKNHHHLILSDKRDSYNK